MSITDYDGKELIPGARVAGWVHGIPYTGTLMHVLPPYPGTRYRNVIVSRDDDGSGVETFSDALVQPGSSQFPGGES